MEDVKPTDSRPPRPQRNYKVTIEANDSNWSEQGGYWRTQWEEIYIQHIDAIDLQKIVAAVNDWKESNDGGT